MPVAEADAGTLALELGAALAAHGWLCATAESCTGGLVAGAITAIAGSSEWFDRGFVTYSNEAKVEMLGVLPATLAAYGAVSEPVAREMAEGAVSHSRARCAMAVTGIAGPDGGTQEKPVGTVCFGFAAPGRTPLTTTKHFPGDRAAVREAAVREALRGLVSIVAAGSPAG
jgi:nicotinamide-nucleotide amidase